MKCKNNVKGSSLVFFKGFLILFLISLNFEGYTQFQEYVIEKIQDEGYVTGGRTNTIFQDKHGFLWMGTMSGLCRYDGYDFECRSYVVNDSTSILKNAVYFAFENQLGEIWIAGSNYVSKLNRNDFTFTHYWPKKNIEGFFSSHYSNDLKGNIWIAGDKSLGKFHTISREWTFFNCIFPGEERLNQIALLYLDNENRIWLSIEGKLYNGRMEGSDSIRFSQIKIKSSLQPAVVHHIWQDQQNDHWISTDQGLFNKPKDSLIFTSNHLLNKLPLINKPVGFVNRDEDGNFWIKTKDTTYIYDPIVQKYNKISYLFYAKNSQPTGIDFNIFHDRSGCHWAYSDLGNLIKISNINSYFRHLKHLPKKDNSITEGTVFPIFEDKDEILWIGTVRGLTAYDQKQNTFTKYYHEEGNPNSLIEQRVASINEDEKGNIWIGSAFKGLTRFDKTKNEFRRFQSKPENSLSISTNLFIRYIFKDSKDRLWVGRLNGVSRLMQDNEHFKNFELFEGASDLDQDQIFDLVEDNNGDVWAGGSDKLFRIQSVTDSITVFDPKIVKHNILGLHYHYSTGYLFIATQAEGVLVFDPEEESFRKNYTTQDGLPSNTVYSFLEDDNENLWMSTSKGISKFNPFKETFSNFGKIDGLKFDDFSSSSYFKKPNGEMYFGGEQVVIFHPDSIQKSEDNFQPSIVISDLKVFGKSKKFEKDIADLETIHLTSNDSYFEIYFSSIDYRFPNKRSYRYKLEDFDKDWVYINNRNYANYTNLPVGDYTMKVQATNSYNRWSKSELTLNIIIHPSHISEYVWFYPGLAILIVGSLLFLGLKRVKTQQKRKEAENIKIRELLEHKAQLAGLEAMRSQMNPHFLFNVLNSGNSFIAENDLITANKFLVDFGKLMRYILNNSKSHLVSLENELKFIRLYLDFEHLRFSDKFDFVIQVDPSLDANKTMLPSMLIQPILENAINHGLIHKKEKGILKLEFKFNENHLLCQVIDNGIGRMNAKKINDSNPDKFQATGFQNVRERIDIIKKLYQKNIHLKVVDLESPNKTPTGTLVEIIIEDPTNWQL